MIAKWLQQHLENCGLWNVDRVSRTVHAARCKKCRRMLYTGLDADLIAGVARVDPDPISATGEAVAHLLGLRTYSLRWQLDSLTLDLRTHFEIRGHPAGTVHQAGRPPPYDVVAEHRCDVLALPGVESVHNTPRIPDYNAPPPY